MNGAGNDFVIIDRRYKNINISKKLINKLSDRKSGAGCDQLITINNKLSDDHDVFIKIYVVLFFNFNIFNYVIICNNCSCGKLDKN